MGLVGKCDRMSKKRKKLNIKESYTFVVVEITSRWE
jgi:hypothetical protein